MRWQVGLNFGEDADRSCDGFRTNLDWFISSGYDAFSVSWDTTDGSRLLARSTSTGGQSAQAVEPSSFCMILRW